MPDISDSPTRQSDARIMHSKPPRPPRPYRRLRQISHHLTWFLGTRFPKAIPLVFVVGYPKSGTTWACRLR